MLRYGSSSRICSGLLCCAALASLLAPLPGQAPTAATDAKLPALGEPAAVPEGAPVGMATITRGLLRDHAYWLADDARGGRYTGSEGQLATAEYVASRFEELGLKPLGDKRGYLQHYPVERVELGKDCGLSFGSERVEQGFAVLHSSGKDKVRISGRFAWCGNGAPTALAGKLKGRIPLVVLDDGSGGGVGGDLRAVQRFVAIARGLEKAGATAAVVCLVADGGSLANTLNYRALMPDHARLGFGSLDQPLVGIPLLVLGADASHKLLAHVGAPADGGGEPSNEKATGKLTITTRVARRAEACNVVAVLEGGDRKAEAVVFSAHHDHVGTRIDGDRFNGADDNASGTAGLLAIAAAFAKAESRPSRSIVFLSVSGEELGLWGSQYYAAHPTWPLARIIADVNIDMIGRAGRDQDRIAMQVTPSHQHAKYSTLVRDGVALGEKLGITFTSGDQYYARSDHYNFAKKGVPVVFFCDGEHPDYHKVTDEADKLDYVSMEAVARLAFWTGWLAAEANGRPVELGKQDAW